MATRKNTTAAAPPAAPYPMTGPLGDLLAVEAMLDLLRIAVERDFANGRFECRQESAAVTCGHALRLVHRARLSVTKTFADAFERGQS